MARASGPAGPLVTAAWAAGVTRLADVTGFDRVGLPVWQAVRPTARSLSVSQGKGRSHRAARIGALMETLELWHAERLPPGLLRPPSAAEAALWGAHLPPSYRWVGPVAWLQGEDLLADRPLAVPRDLVSLDTTGPASSPMAPISTGLAGRDTLEGAEIKALCEILEREAAHWFDGLGPLERRALEVEAAAIAQPHRPARWLVARIARAGLALRLWDVSERHRCPTFLAILLDPGHGPMPIAPALGMCCHPDPGAALFGALAEACQTRVTEMAGAREDIEGRDYADPKGRAALFLLLTLAISGARATVPSWPMPPDAAGRRAALIARIADSGAPAVARLVLRDEPGLAFVKLLAPGLADSERPLS